MTDQRMLSLPELLKDHKKIKFQQEFCDSIKMPKQNIRNVKAGIQHFTATHIRNACISYDINANWIMGLSEDLFIEK